MKKLAFLVLIMSVLVLSGQSQELACRVTVTTAKMQGAGATSVDKAIFKALEQNLSSFMNDRKWTNYNYRPEERIDCSIQIDITQAKGNDIYEGTFTVNMSRPVFNSTYPSPLFTYQDNNISFRYSVNQTFEYDENSYVWTVTSVAAYYANLFLGLFYDSQSMNGGTEFYNKCMNIINTAPSSESGWSNSKSEKRSRYWLLESFTNPANAEVRNFLYLYHRQGLDLFAQNINKGLENVTTAINSLQQLYIKNPTLVSISLICVAKYIEFANVYSGAPLEMRQKIVPVLKRIDPVNSDKYEKLLQQ